MPNKTLIDLGLMPFIKWRGGKRRLAQQIIKKFPPQYENYYEPFLGGGAVFLQSYFLSNKYIFLSDINPYLINMWEMITQRTDEVVDLLDSYFSTNHDEEFYYDIRNTFMDIEYRDTDPDIYRAAAFIYMNKSCFNGLWRTNLNGKLNMSFGKGQFLSGTPLVNEDLVRKIALACSTNVRFNNRSVFETPLPQPKSLFYCDPPYNDTNVMYDKARFGIEEQEKLKGKMDEWTKADCYVMISNKNTEYIQDLYKDYKILNVLASHVISGRASGRRKVKEVLITNY